MYFLPSLFHLPFTISSPPHLLILFWGLFTSQSKKKRSSKRPQSASPLRWAGGAGGQERLLRRELHEGHQRHQRRGDADAEGQEGGGPWEEDGRGGKRKGVGWVHFLFYVIISYIVFKENDPQFFSTKLECTPCNLPGSHCPVVSRVIHNYPLSVPITSSCKLKSLKVEIIKKDELTKRYFKSRRWLIYCCLPLFGWIAIYKKK